MTTPQDAAREAAWLAARATMPNYVGPVSGEWGFAHGYDAGRASRDAEIAQLVAKHEDCDGCGLIDDLRAALATFTEEATTVPRAAS